MRMKRTLSIQRLSMKKRMSSMLRHMNGLDETNEVNGTLMILQVMKKRMQLMMKKVIEADQESEGEEVV
eukprot:12933368-Prorocentrum_lima.AAC.1